MDVLERFRWELRNVQWQGETLEQTPTVTRRIRSHGCEVVCFDTPEERLEEIIRKEADIARERGLELEWKAFSFDSPSLTAHLESAGFAIGAREALLTYDMEVGSDRWMVECSADVRRIESLEMIPDFLAASNAAFRRDLSRVADELAEAIRTGRSGHVGYLAYVEGVPASVGRLYTDAGSVFAGLYGGGTAPEFRGRGLYRAVVAARARDAKAHGSRYLLVDALPTSQPILLRLGFERVGHSTPCTLKPSAT